MCLRVQSLQEIDSYLKNHTAFLGGDRPNAVDCMIAPRLYHIQVAMKELKVRLNPVRAIARPSHSIFQGTQHHQRTLWTPEDACTSSGSWGLQGLSKGWCCGSVAELGDPERFEGPA